MSSPPQPGKGRPATAASGQPARPRGDVWFLLVLIVLAGLAALLWLSDPSHAFGDKSRIPWPEPKPHKP